MNKQQPTTSVRHNDAFSQGLMSSYTRWMGGEGFQGSTLPEESIPSLEKKETKDDFSQKDPKAKAGAPDPATNLRAGTGVKQSHGAEIRDTTKIVAREGKETCSKCGKSPCECRAREGYRIALQNKFRALGAKNPIILGDIDHKRFVDIMSKDKVTMKDAL